MKKSLSIFLIILILLKLQQACTKDKYEIPGKNNLYTQEPTNNNSTENICDTATIKYSNYIANIINTNCGSCHPEYTNYIGLKNIADNGSLKLRAIDGTPSPMPPASSGGLLPQSTRDSILWWINSGKCQ